MRERPKHPSYLERHRQAEDGESKTGYKLGQRRSLSNQPANLSSLAVPSVLPKKADKGITSNASRVRVGASARAAVKSIQTSDSTSGGHMTQFRSLDDIPDGLPESPQKGGSNHGVFATKSFDEVYADADEDDDGDDDDWKSNYVAARISESFHQPMLPSERAASDSRPGSNQLSKYPPLQGDSNGKSRPIVYPTSRPRSVRRSNVSDDEDDNNWDNDSDDESQPTRKSISKSSLCTDEEPIKGKYDSKSSGVRQPVSQNRKIGAPIKSPPELPFEAMQEKADVKDQLYFSKQPRQIDYTPYTLGQYRASNPKEYVEIVPHIKPDLNTDILKAKRANADRIKDFSKQLNEFNKVSLGDQRRLPYSSEASGVQISKKKLESNRERAMQFAKNIPRPVVKGKEMKSSDGDGDGEDDMADRLMSGSDYGVIDQKAFKLEELQAKHLESKRSIDAMRKQMGM